MNETKSTPPSQNNLRVAIPMVGGKFSEHFGGAREFMIYEGNRENLRLDLHELRIAPPHKPGALPLWLAENHVDAVVASSIGERAMKILTTKDIGVFLTLGADDPVDLALQCLAGTLPPATPQNTRCNGHHDHHEHKCHHH